MAFLPESETDTQESEPSKAGGLPHRVNVTGTRNAPGQIPALFQPPPTDSITGHMTRAHTDAQKQPNIYTGGARSPANRRHHNGDRPGKGYPNTRPTALRGNNPDRMQIVRRRRRPINQSARALAQANNGVTGPTEPRPVRTAATRRRRRAIAPAAATGLLTQTLCVVRRAAITVRPGDRGGTRDRTGKREGGRGRDIMGEDGRGRDRQD